MKLFEIVPDLWIYLGIVLILIILVVISELFKSEKIKSFFEKIIEAIKDFFNFPF